MNERHDDGFTLIELLVVVIALGVLASIVVFAIASQPVSAVRTGCRADVRMVESAQEAHRAVNGTFAADINGLVPSDLRQPPRNATHYLITTDITGAVYVTLPAAGVPVSADVSPSPCASAT